MSEHICPICQDKLDETRIFTPCIHGFHKKCLIQHLLVVEESENYFYDPERKIPCPICRNDMHIITAELRDSIDYKNAKNTSSSSTGLSNNFMSFNDPSMYNMTLNEPSNDPLNIRLTNVLRNGRLTGINIPSMNYTTFNEPANEPLNISSLRNITGNERLEARNLNHLTNRPNNSNLFIRGHEPLRRSINDIIPELPNSISRHQSLIHLINSFNNLSRGAQAETQNIINRYTLQTQTENSQQNQTENSQQNQTENSQQTQTENNSRLVLPAENNVTHPICFIHANRYMPYFASINHNLISSPAANSAAANSAAANSAANSAAAANSAEVTSTTRISTNALNMPNIDTETLDYVLSIIYDENDTDVISDVSNHQNNNSDDLD
jgi:hypothetical protein